MPVRRLTLCMKGFEELARVSYRSNMLFLGSCLSHRFNVWFLESVCHTGLMQGFEKLSNKQVKCVVLKRWKPHRFNLGFKEAMCHTGLMQIFEKLRMTQV